MYTCACLPPKDSCETLTSGYCFSGNSCTSGSHGAVVNGGGGCGDGQVCCAGQGCYRKAKGAICADKKGKPGICFPDDRNVLKCLRNACAGLKRGDDCTITSSKNGTCEEHPAAERWDEFLICVAKPAGSKSSKPTPTPRNPE